jgi:hypothetical protein
MALTLDGNGTMTVGNGSISGLSVGGLPTGVINSTNIVDATIAQGDLDTSIIPLGVGQTWQSMGASRAIGTTYTNTTGRTIVVIVSGTGGGANGLWGVTLNSAISYYTPSTYTASVWTACEFIVPAGQTYALSQQGSNVTLQNWSELR